MTTSPATWNRAERLDPTRIAAAVHAATGVRYAVEGRCPGGEVGAAYVRRDDGHRAVLTWRPGVTLAEMEVGPLAVTEALRASGYPAPATELAVQLGEDVAVVQELLPGSKIDLLTPGLLEQVLQLRARHVGALAGRVSVPVRPLHLLSSGPGHCLHEPPLAHSARTADLVRRVRAVGEEFGDVLPGDDAVHGDFHPGNVLESGGIVTGVVDWDGAARGDAAFDLVNLRFGVHPQQDVDPAVVHRIDALLDELPPAVLRPAWAHLSLRMADWAIRHFPEDELTGWVELAESRLSD
ncbi:phosphotransferase enzyme family protein [Streptomyces boninensis]|uniref:phosphotransferase enzyme family protein n=1 Tax=Streptomyces boninensis TaxID=2039455 RepID=UPI003B216B26